MSGHYTGCPAIGYPWCKEFNTKDIKAKKDTKKEYLFFLLPS
jgi:hypothetical protein